MRSSWQRIISVSYTHLNRLCAVKVSKGREEQKRSFAIAEKELLKRLTHPGLPAILDFFEEKGNFCIVMEYVEGITLEQMCIRDRGRTEYSHHRKPVCKQCCDRRCDQG